MKLLEFAFDNETYRAVYITNGNEAVSVLNSLTCGLYGLDIETGKVGDEEKAGLDPRHSFIRLIQLYDDRIKTIYVFDLLSVLSMLFASSLELFLRKAGNEFVAHNALFEIKHLSQKIAPLDNNFHCSMMLSQLIDQAEHSQFEEEDEDDPFEIGMGQYKKAKGFGLDSLVQQYFGIKVDKTYQTSDWNDSLEVGQIVYAALDAVLTKKLFDLLYPKIEKHKMTAYYHMVKKLQHIVAEMETNGLYLNVEHHEKLLLEWMQKLQDCKQECYVYFKDVNVRSPVQLNKWLVENQTPDNLATWPRTKPSIRSPQGNYTFQKNKLTDQLDIPAIKALLQFKHYDKLISSYGMDLREEIDPLTNRIHPSYSICRTRTGRMSCYHPNLQNIPRESNVRDMFQAEEGNVLIVADFNQIEMRVAAELSGDRNMRSAFINGIDLHKLIVAKTMGIDYGAVTKNERQMGKAINFGLLFGMGAKKLVAYAKQSYGVSLSYELASEAYSVFHKKLYARYSAWCQTMREHVAELGFVRTPKGKVRRLLPDEVYTKSVNTPVQGGAAEGLAQSLISFNINSLHGSRLVTTVHDEIVIESSTDKAEHNVALLKQEMIGGMLSVFPNMPTNNLVEVKIAKSWGAAK